MSLSLFACAVRPNAAVSADSIELRGLLHHRTIPWSSCRLESTPAGLLVRDAKDKPCLFSRVTRRTTCESKPPWKLLHVTRSLATERCLWPRKRLWVAALNRNAQVRIQALCGIGPCGAGSRTSVYAPLAPRARLCLAPGFELVRSCLEPDPRISQKVPFLVDPTTIHHQGWVLGPLEHLRQ